MSEPVLEAVVVGAGAAGLAAASELAQAGHAPLVLEASARVGGSAWSERRGPWLFERGANTFRLSANAASFFARRRLDPVLLAASPASRERFLLRGGRLAPVPLGLLGFARTPLLSWRGKLRLLAEPFVRGGDPRGETVAAFTTRRLGAEACEQLVEPFLTGVYAGDAQRLGAEAVFPSLVAAELRSGSIVRGLLAGALRRRGEPRGRAGTWSSREGLSGLIRALAGPLAAAVRVRTRVSEITLEDGVYDIGIEGESRDESLRARRLVLAVPPHQAAGLLGRLDAEAGAILATLETAPVASVSLGVETERARVPIRGFGFLVPRGEMRGDGEALLGCLFPSSLFPGRAPEGRALLTVLAGGLRRPDALDWTDERLVGALVAELERVLGLGAAPELLAVTRWPRAVAQPGPEHPRRLAAVRERLGRLPGLALAGAGYDGVAFGEALASGAAAARAVLARQGPGPERR